MNEETKSSDIYEHPYNDLIQEGNWYDHGTGIFELKQSRFGLWTRHDKEGKGIITALTKGALLRWNCIPPTWGQTRIPRNVYVV